MATRKAKKRVTNKKSVPLSAHVESVASAVHGGVVRALATGSAGGKGPQLTAATQNTGIGPHVDPKTIYVTVTYVYDVS